MAKVKKQFDFTKYKQRHIALKILYFGWDYDGLAEQLDNQKTVEFHLFQALTKTCLVESRASCNYNRCGRTDKGVSSYGQVVNLNVRSNLIDEHHPSNVGLFTPDGYIGGLDSARVSKQSSQELNYVEILNRVLPDHIKIIAWAPVRNDFSSRFNCQSRSYSYIFPIGDLCIDSMKEALGYLVGQHDFRNLCSFDLKNGVTNHRRTIISAQIKPLSTLSLAATPSQYSFYEIIIVGQAFLYHQIRCIMTIIFLVGSKKEPPVVVRDLLDLEKCPSRPNYNRASPLPLSLFDCEYNLGDIPLGWTYDSRSLNNLLRQLKNLWLQYRTKSLMIEKVLSSLEVHLKDDHQTSSPPKADKIKSKQSSEDPKHHWKDFGLECDNMSDTKYVPLLKRPRDEPLEKKLIFIERKKAKSIDKEHGSLTDEPIQDSG